MRVGPATRSVAAIFCATLRFKDIAMADPRINKLADLLLDHSCKIKKGERVFIEAFDLPEPTLVCQLVEGAAKRGALALVSWKSNEILRSLYNTATEESMTF